MITDMHFEYEGGIARVQYKGIHIPDNYNAVWWRQTRGHVRKKMEREIKLQSCWKWFIIRVTFILSFMHISCNLSKLIVNLLERKGLLNWMKYFKYEDSLWIVFMQCCWFYSLYGGCTKARILNDISFWWVFCMFLFVENNWDIWCAIDFEYKGESIFDIKTAHSTLGHA